VDTHNREKKEDRERYNVRERRRKGIIDVKRRVWMK
jgi:hypothetical protein